MCTHFIRSDFVSLRYYVVIWVIQLRPNVWEQHFEVEVRLAIKLEELIRTTVSYVLSQKITIPFDFETRILFREERIHPTF